jgi:hypothetical protein
MEPCLVIHANVASTRCIVSSWQNTPLPQSIGGPFSIYLKTWLRLARELDGDLSHFNRNFKRRYGASPSEIRAEAARPE